MSLDDVAYRVLDLLMCVISHNQLEHNFLFLLVL